MPRKGSRTRDARGADGGRAVWVCLALAVVLVACGKAAVSRAPLEIPKPAPLEAAAPVSAPPPPASAIPALRTIDNFEPRKLPLRSPLSEDDPRNVWKIPVGTSPVVGKPDALVTIVSFQNLESEFCKKVQATLRELRSRYGDDLRLVFKHNPLPFHLRALPAAMLAIEARAQKGEVTFWQAVDLLYAASPGLGDAELARIGRELKLDVARATQAVEKGTHEAVVLADQTLAMDFNARGTPHFFINGRRFPGAQPLADFVEVVDEELDKARDLVARGTPRSALYAELMKTARDPAPPERREVRPPSAPRPSRGPSTAEVTIEIFGDLECPFTRRAMPTLDALQQRYPGQIRLVFRNLPLEFHRGAVMAAEAALEARAQKGDAAFWRMVPLIQAELDDPAALREDDLVGHGVSAGLDGPRMRAALRDGRHRAAVEEDAKAARDARIHAAPSFLVNGYFLSGEQRIESFSRLIDRAIRERSSTRGVPR